MVIDSQTLRSCMRLTHWALVATLGGGCVAGGDSKFEAGVVLPSEAPFGPKVVFDPLARPVPEVPLPNDLLLRTDGQGLAWNVSEHAPTRMEQSIREHLPRLDGFGSFAPISVAFDAPLDLDTVGPHSVRVVDITEGGAHRGEEVELDFGGGAFPIVGGGRFWAFDEDDDLPDFLLPRDNDWMLAGSEQRVTHYEVETSTLLVRPLEPLRAGARYAVLLTRAIKGLPDDAGVERSIRSPFPYKAHAAQTGLVAEALELAGVDKSDLAFGWTFAVNDPQAPLLEVREGLYGRGRLAPLEGRFINGLGEIRDTGISIDADGVNYPSDPRDHRFIVQGEFLDNILGIVIGLALRGLRGARLQVRRLRQVFGTLQRRPTCAGGDHKTFGAKPLTREGETGLPWLPLDPKDDRGATSRRFRRCFYFHGTATSRVEVLVLARRALAAGHRGAVAFDQVGHGSIIPSTSSRWLSRRPGHRPDRWYRACCRSSWSS